jgi:CBS domain-containing protein
MRVLELMKAHLVKAEPGATLREAVDTMDLYQVADVPVVDDEDHLLGLITEEATLGPLLAWYADGEPAEGAAREGLGSGAEAVFARPVASAMTFPVPTIDEHADVLEAARLMRRSHLTRLPVLGGGKLVGLISRIDICQAILDGQLGDPGPGAGP